MLSFGRASLFGRRPAGRKFIVATETPNSLSRLMRVVSLGRSLGRAEKMTERQRRQLACPATQVERRPFDGRLIRAAAEKMQPLRIIVIIIIPRAADHDARSADELALCA